jgi:Uncharacterized conserved protein (some members contain a von Willebrand factor type A (vWA) domain)
VELTERSLGIVILISGLGLYSILSDDVPALVILLSLAVFLFFRAVLFYHTITLVSGSVACERSVGKTIIRQGTPIPVRTAWSCTIPEECTVTFEDLIPAGAAIQNGTASANISGPGENATVSGSYSISPVVSGDIMFMGVRAIIRDHYFTSAIEFRLESFRRPALHIEPVAIFEHDEGSGRYGETETEKASPIHGYGIRSFRHYIEGDDPRTIDWKMTAKHGKIFVREYSGLAGEPPLLVVDLPDASSEYSTRSYDLMIGGMNDALRAAVRENRGCSLLIISGPNLLKFVPFEKSTVKARKTIDTLRGRRRLLSWYRTLDPGHIRVFLRNRENPGSHDQKSFSSGLAQIYQHFLPAAPRSRFEIQFKGVLNERKITGIYLFSLFNGDLSHIRSVILQGRSINARVILQVPSESAGPGMFEKISRLGASDVKVIR